MNLSTFEFSLDIHSIESQLHIDVKRNDTGRKLLISLSEHGNPYEITPECSARFRTRKSDGTVIYNECTIVDNEIHCEITQEIVAVAGMFDCEITLSGADGRQITSPKFTLVVHDIVLQDEEIESTNEFTALTKTMTAAATLIGEVENKLANGELKGDKGDRGVPGKVKVEDFPMGIDYCDTSLIGNDFDENEAYSDFSSSFGSNTKAGGKGYRIVSVVTVPLNDGLQTYTLNTVDGLEVGMEICVKLASVNFKISKIENITGRDVTVSVDRTLEMDDETSPLIPANYLIVIGRPDLGDIDVGLNSFVVGLGNIAQDFTTFAGGRDNKAVQQYAFVVGRDNVGGYACFVAGRGNTVIGNCNAGFGRLNLVTGEAALAFGWGNIVRAFAAKASGCQTEANADYSDSSGYMTKANGIASRVGGAYSTSDGNYSDSYGYGVNASGEAAHARGQGTNASGNYSDARNRDTTASGLFSSSSGFGTEASGEAATAMGEFSKATSSCTLSHGYKTEANAPCSRAGGSTCKVTGQNASAEGYGLLASGYNQHVSGTCNIEDTENKYAVIVGNGQGLDNRSNAHTIDWSGNAWFAGSIEGTALYLKSPSGYRFLITVDDNGVLTTRKI